MSNTERLVVASTTAVDDHLTGGGHPERPDRLLAVEQGLVEAGVPLARLATRAAEQDELARVHTRAHLQHLEQFVAAGAGHLDGDTPTSSGSWRSATHAAGAVLAAIDALRAGEGAAAFVACRPPGHHATAGQAMGFCLLNNVAVGAAALAADGERVLVVDWDVHHGNGTQDIFWDDPRVLYVSLHESPAYPGTGPATDTGGPGAPGLTVNVPLPSGATGDVAVRALDEVVAPVVDRFDPTWVLISAGYDAHRDDPLASLAWSSGDYSLLTARAMAFAPRAGRTVAVLEGGYDLDALRRSVTATACALLGAAVMPEAPTSGGPGVDAVARASRARADVDDRLG